MEDLWSGEFAVKAIFHKQIYSDDLKFFPLLEQ